MIEFAEMDDLIGNLTNELIAAKERKCWDEIAETICRNFPGTVTTGRDLERRVKGLLRAEARLRENACDSCKKAQSCAYYQPTQRGVARINCPLWQFGG